MAEDDSRRGSGGPRRREWIAVGLILLTAAWLHLEGISRPFFADDYLFLEQARSKSLAGLLASPDPLGNFFRPVSRQLYFWLIARLGHESPVVFHVVGLGLFLASLAVLYLLARRLLDRVSALFAIAFVALHYAADVPLSWASGSQDLLAVLFATGAVHLHASGRRAAAPIALVLALLSKEAVAGAVVVAIAADHVPNESVMATLRRAAGLLSVTVAWALWWVSSLAMRPTAGNALSWEPGNPVAACVHLVQTALGLEFRLGGGALGHWAAYSLLPAALGVAILSWSAATTQRPPSRPSPAEADFKRHRAVRVGALWVAAALLPLIPVMPIWSAYFFLWTLFGVALLGAAVTASVSPAPRAAMLGGLILLSANARRLDEFATSGGAWSWQSHVNQHYIDRSLNTTAAYLRHMRAARPYLPPRSTVFFANVPASSGWQTADGPLLRWAYRDSTLRSYYMTEFSRPRAARGPVWFFAVEGESLLDKTGDPQLLPSFAFSMLLAEKPRPAIDALDAALAATPGLSELHYWRGLAHLGSGDSLAARDDLRRGGIAPSRDFPRDAKRWLDAAGADSAARIRALLRIRNAAGLSPWVHARLAAILLARGRTEEGVVEAYAYRVLAPDEPDAWRKWAAAQLSRRQYAPALGSLEHYVALLRPHGTVDPEARAAIESLRRLVRGDLAQDAVRNR